MSTPEWPERDDELDAMLAGLGTPEQARPLATPAEILGRAAMLAPPVVGLAGWRLAAALALAVGGGFLGGLWMHQSGSGDATPNAVASLPTPPESPSAPPAPAPEPPRAVASAAPDRTRPVRYRGPAPTAVDTAAIVTRVLPEGPACPTPASELTDSDVLAIASKLPPAETPPAKAPVAPSPDDDTVADKDLPTAITHAGHPLEGSVGVGAVLLPGVASGLVADAGLMRAPAVAARGGGILAADLDVGLVTAAPTARWTTALQVEAGRAWRFGRTELDAGWTLGARLVLPARPADAALADAATGPLANQGLGVFPVTGPRLGVALGQAGSRRVRADLSAQVGPGAPGDGPQSWISLAVSSTFPFSKKES